MLRAGGSPTGSRPFLERCQRILAELELDPEHPAVERVNPYRSPTLRASLVDRLSVGTFLFALAFMAEGGTLDGPSRPTSAAPPG